MTTLVLVRHGKPEHGGPGTPDALRALTPEGHAAIAGPLGFARTFSLLTPEERARAVIWSSPAVRARQTADVVAEALGGRAIAEHACIWEQDNASFLAEVAATAEHERCIIAVGHIPFMNELTAYLTGVPVSFKPGAACAIELDRRVAGGSGRIAWFVQGPEV